MWPVLGGLVSGMMNFFAAEQNNKQSAANVAATNAMNLAMQREAQAFNQGEAATNRQFQAEQVLGQQQFGREMVSQQEAFQREMSGTAVQRAKADMIAAGLNPAMMFGRGAAASTPSGSTASSGAGSGSAASTTPTRFESPAFHSPIAGLADVVNKTISNAVQVKTIDKMTEEIANLRTTRAQVEAQTATERERPSHVRQEVRTRRQDERTSAAHEAAVRTNLPVIVNAAKTAANELGMNESTRWWLDVLGLMGRRSSQMVSPITDLVGSARGVQRMIVNPSGGGSF